MNLAYVLYSLDSAESGVSKKIANQAASWVELGHKVTVIRGGPSDKRDGYEKACARAGAKLVYRATDGAVGRWGRWLGLKKIMRAGNFDAVYHRFDLATPGLVAAMEPGKWVVELNTNDLTEYAIAPGLRNSYNKWTRNGLFRRAAGAVFISEELSRSPTFAAFNSHRLVLGNGGDFSVKPTPAPAATDPVVLLFMAGEGQEWHGIDKLPLLARENPDWKILVLGVSRYDSAEPLPPNLEFHPRMTREQYEPIVAKCAAGIGSLGLHRIQMFEGSPLKVREYAAFGLPLILACRDVDVPERAPYALYIPNTEDNIATSLPDIREFVEKWRGRRVPREQVAHMDWKVKERTRLDFIRKVVGAR
jgi:hypothetical protein